jgi:hypothetical protein
MNSKLLIFVSGIPTGTLVDELEKSFLDEGYTVRLHDKRRRPLPRNSHLNMGFCLAEVREPEIFDALKKVKYVLFRRRHLMVQRYLAGKELHESNSYKNKRRILLKRVPSSLPEASVRQFLAKSFGPISEMYALKPDGKGSSPPFSFYKANSKTYSVIFECPINHLLARPTSMEIVPGCTVIAELFVVYKRGFRNQANPRSVSPKLDEHNQGCLVDDSLFPIINSISLKKLDHGDYPQSSALQKVQKTKPERRFSLDFVNPRFRTDPPKRDTAFGEEISKRASFSMEARRKLSTGYSRSEFISELLSMAHHLKPVSSAYRLLRGEEPEYLATFELPNTWIALSNFRFNKNGGRIYHAMPLTTPL